MVFYYNIHGPVLAKVDEVRDLGIIVRNDLTFTSHINSIVTQTWAMIKRVFDRNRNPMLMRPLFDSLVRSKLEYNSVSWDHNTKDNLIKLESVHRRATGHMLGVQQNNKDMLSALNILP
jgi:hypothetical protein